MSKLAELSTFEIPPTEAQVGTVIWMHGLGATNRDFEDVVPIIDAPGLRFVFPAAPKLPVTINGGAVMPAWYDILSFDDPPFREDEASVRTGAELVTALIERELTRGVSAEKIVLMGFSQGGAMALHVGSRFGQRLAGIGVLSAYLLLPDAWRSERSAANSKTPVLFCHGEQDPVVPHALGLSARRAVLAEGVPVVAHDFAMQHSLCMEELLVLKRWLLERFQPIPATSA